MVGAPGIDNTIQYQPTWSRLWGDAQRQGRQSLWDRRTCSPNIYEGGESMVMSPNILEVMSFILSSDSNNSCLLYFNANIMCSFTKIFSFCGTSSPRLPTRALPLDPAWGLPSPRPPVLFHVPPIILWDRRPCPEGARHLGHVTISTSVHVLAIIFYWQEIRISPLKLQQR